MEFFLLPGQGVEVAFEEAEDSTSIPNCGIINISLFFRFTVELFWVSLDYGVNWKLTFLRLNPSTISTSSGSDHVNFGWAVLLTWMPSTMSLLADTMIFHWGQLIAFCLFHLCALFCLVSGWFPSLFFGRLSIFFTWIEWSEPPQKCLRIRGKLNTPTFFVCSLSRISGVWRYFFFPVAPEPCGRCESMIWFNGTGTYHFGTDF